MIRAIAGAALIAMTFGSAVPTAPAYAQGCPKSVDQCVAVCNAKGGLAAQKGRCGQFCANRPCMAGGGAGRNAGAGAGPGGQKRNAQIPVSRGQAEGRSPAQPFLKTGREFLDQGKFQAALTEFDRAVKADPKWVWNYMWRGTAYNRLGQLKMALADYDKGLEIDPKHFGLLVGRGSAYRSMGEFGSALAALNAAGEINPSGAEPYAFRAMIYSSQGDQARGLKEANTAVQLNPRYFQSYGSLGTVYAAMRQYDKAADAFDKAMQLYPHNFGNMVGRGTAYFNMGDGERALKDFAAALAINPNYGPALVNRARVYIERGQHESAIADLDKAVQNSPKNVPALLQRAKAHELSRNFAAAREDYAAVVGQFPSHGVATAGVERMEARLAGKDGRVLAQNRSGGRVALVIGNSKYTAIDKLANPERDARLVADTLQKVGFEKVELLLDGSRETVTAKLKSFADAAANADWAVVYYAGHGIEFDGSNYLVPVDVKFEQDADIPKESVALDLVLNAVGVAGKLRLVILDACRENPFATDMKRTDATSVGRGLARLEPESGTLVAFATKHGRTATDGTGVNSPFASALVRRMLTPGLEVNQIFRLVKQQEPFTYGQLPAQQFYFKQ
jgi:tetratricopeptide (TPR) repeat protein